MKKAFLCIAVLCALIFGISCSQGKRYGIIEYQNNDITAECTVNGKYGVTIVCKEGFCSLTVSSPAELCGVSFEYNGNECYAISGDIKIPFEKEKLGGIFALMGIFDLDEQCVKTIKSENGDGTISFESPLGTYVMTFDGSGMPKRAVIESPDYKYDVTINTLVLEKRK